MFSSDLVICRGVAFGDFQVDSAVRSSYFTDHINLGFRGIYIMMVIQQLHEVQTVFSPTLVLFTISATQYGLYLS